MSKFTNVPHLADKKKIINFFCTSVSVTTPRTEKISRNWPVCIAGLACLVQQINSLYQLDSRQFRQTKERRKEDAEM